MDIATIITFTFACFALVIVPGPTVTVIVANALKSGTRAGLLNIAGTEFGLLLMLVMLAFGLDLIVTQLGFVFEILRCVGAAYLVYLGWSMWRSNGQLGRGNALRAPSDWSFFWQGFLVIWSNPKALVFFGAFIPQFIDPAADAVVQTLVLGGIFMVVAAVFDSCYAIFAGRAGHLLSHGRIRLVERISGSALIGGGVWLALSKNAQAT